MNKMNNDMLKQIIINTIKGEEHLGENLKEQCVYYIEQLQNNWNELKQYIEEWLIKNETWYSNSLSIHDKNYYRKDYLLRKANLTEIKNKMQELEGNNESKRDV